MAFVLDLDAGRHIECRLFGRGCLPTRGPAVLVPVVPLVLVGGGVVHGQRGGLPVHVPLLVLSWPALLVACLSGHREGGWSWSARSSRACTRTPRTSRRSAGTAWDFLRFSKSSTTLIRRV